MDPLQGEYPRPLSETTVRALALYRDLQAELEPGQIGRGVAIHPDSGDYLVADTPTHAGHAMRVRHPEGGTVTLRIGLLPDYGLASRIIQSDMIEGKQQGVPIWKAR